ncbi:DUF2062 domain-containing protein [Pelotomaculum propionicicum]|uniref:DUF2062 domain-containing protein n=1 Tax=Pelotomaculum propionicicum TaxID=258475 RepID=A0A4Y7RY17_9FIRM|nr:DUF2062 domain-containing protein [Pelotomaculum propionicicum]TEB13650.1 hypothetical protein Pmgp_00050 [Pelotomaculum propionicicum]
MFFQGVLYFKKKIATPVLETIRNYYNRMMELPDSPKKIAKGVALGLAFDFLPIPIISIPLSYLVARLIRCNPVAAVATVVFFKLAVPFFYTLNLMVGKVFLGDMPGPDMPYLIDAGPSIVTNFINSLVEHGYPFLLGSVLNATLVFVLVYFLILFLIKCRRCGGA